MKRRPLLLLPLGFLGSLALADSPKVQSLDEALRWLERLERAAAVDSSTAWPMPAVLAHLAQSIEMSMDGFPQPNSALFQSTVGAAAFAVFRWRGSMNHSLTEPIPGAAALPGPGDWKPAAARLRAAIARFSTHQGPLKPHFAYGALSRSDFALAHVMHIANHQDAVNAR